MRFFGLDLPVKIKLSDVHYYTLLVKMVTIFLQNSI